MDIVLWRHAEAEDSTPDMDRELTLKGRKQAEKIAAFLHQHLPLDTRVLVSPATRTRQTVAAYTEKYTLAPSIAPGASAHAVLQAARWPNGLARHPHPNLPSEGDGANAALRDHKTPADGTVLIVGHQPTLGAVAALLLGSAETSLSIKKGALWWFSRRARDDYAQTTLRLVITPDFL
ncbi:MAG: histidine phosphatase family protein [Gallionella sp.]